MCTRVSVWRPEDNLKGSDLNSYHVDRDQTQAVRLDVNVFLHCLPYWPGPQRKLESHFYFSAWVAGWESCCHVPSENLIMNFFFF